MKKLRLLVLVLYDIEIKVLTFLELAVLLIRVYMCTYHLIELEATK